MGVERAYAATIGGAAPKSSRMDVAGVPNRTIGNRQLKDAA
jgi:hypothetical protein